MGSRGKEKGVTSGSLTVPIKWNNQLPEVPLPAAFVKFPFDSER